MDRYSPKHRTILVDVRPFAGPFPWGADVHSTWRWRWCCLTLLSRGWVWPLEGSFSWVVTLHVVRFLECFPALTHPPFLGFGFGRVNRGRRASENGSPTRASTSSCSADLHSALRCPAFYSGS